MNIWARRTYFILTILVFIIVAILLVFYASGWRYNRSTNKLGLVGALTVTSEPNNAIVHLNDEPLKKSTPTTTNTIIADQYLLKITKDGYFNWTKNIIIEKSKTTRIPFLYLLKKQQKLNPILTYDDINSFVFSPDKNLIFVYSSNKIEVTDLNESKVLFKKNITQKITNILWNNSSDKIIYFSTIDGYRVIDINANKEILISTLINSKIENIYWSTEENDILYITSDNNLHRINIFQKTVTKILEEVNAIFNINNIFFTLQDDELQTVNENGEKISFINISNDSELIFLDQFNEFLPIINETSNKAYFYNLSDDSFEKINETVENIKWINNKLLFSNNHEIWSWDKDESTKQIIIRTSDNVLHADWLLNEYYTLYTTDGENLNIIQTTGTQKNAYSIELSNIINITSKYSENIVYVVTDNDIYKLKF